MYAGGGEEEEGAAYRRWCDRTEKLEGVEPAQTHTYIRLVGGGRVERSDSPLACPLCPFKQAYLGGLGGPWDWEVCVL